MTLDHRHALLSGFAALVAWGIVVRLAPFLWHLVNAFFIGCVAAILGIFWLVVTTSRRQPTTARYSRSPAPIFTLPPHWEHESARRRTNLQYIPVQLHPSSTIVSHAVGELIELALHDFIGSWYKSISTSPVFVNEVDKNVRVALIEIRERLLGQDVVDMIVARIVPIITTHLRDAGNAEKIVRARALNNHLPESEELDLAVAAKYKDGHLHPACSLAYPDTRSLQQEYLRKTLVRILPVLLDESMVRSRVVLVLVKEVVASAVLHPTIQILAEPDTWNQIVEAYGKTTLQDRKTVKEMRTALDEHTSMTAKRQVPNEIPRLQPYDSERAFEKFVRVIRKTKTLADARRFRSQLASQIARESEVEGQDPVFLRRLEMGKRVLEQKITKMTTVENTSILPTTAEKQENMSLKLADWRLVDIMHTAAGLSHFMEFMDRQKKMNLVQFWVVVDGFRNPLEDDFGDEKTTAPITWTDNDRLDIAQIAETYIMKSETNVPAEAQNTVRDFLQAGRRATVDQYRAARMAILSSQSAVLEELEQNYLPKFRESNLYYKFLASNDSKTAQRKRSINVDGTSTVKAAPIQNKPKVGASSMTRTSSHAQIARMQDLRRAALSSSDVKGLAQSKLSDSIVPTRASLDIDRPLFDDDYDTDPLAMSVQSIGYESVNADSQEIEVIENMGAALTDIMAQSPIIGMSDIETDALFGPALVSQKSARPGLDSSRIDSSSFMGEKTKPSLATLGLVNVAGRIGVFQDNDLFGDEEHFAEDEYVDRDDDARKENDVEVHQATPGDLGLTEAVTALSDDIERLVSQESFIDTLTRKAELTNNVAELRILGKSKASLQREIRRKELQRQQYIVQESDNSLYGRASICIESVMVGHEDDGQEYAVYIIKVQRQAGDQMPAASWVIAHRYSEFHDLHQKLRRYYPSTRNLEFPRRRMVMKLQKQFLHNRRVALEVYLQQLLRMPDVCRSREFRSFLSQQAITEPSMNGATTNTTNTQDMVTRIYNSVTDGMDEFLGNIAVLDQLSTAGQNLITAATTQLSPPTSASSFARSATEDVIIAPGSIAEAEAELRAFEDKELAPFVKPICDIFLETFELNRGNNWLRGRAVVVVIHQLLGGTVERKMRDFFASIFAEESLLRHIETVKNTIWPAVTTTNAGTDLKRASQANEPGMRTPRPLRTKVQKQRSRAEAALVLNTLIPELAGTVVGRSNAQSAARRIANVMNNKRLNEHLVYTIFDEVIAFLFEESGAGFASNTKSGKGKVMARQ